MKRGEKKQQGKAKGRELIENLANIGAKVGGEAIKPAHPLEGIALAAAASWFSSVAGQAFQYISDSKGFVAAKEMARVLRLIEPDGADIADLARAAFPIIADAEAEDQRRLIGNILINASARPEAGAQAEAFHAMEIIKGLPPAAARVFPLVAADIAENGLTAADGLSDPLRVPVVEVQREGRPYGIPGVVLRAVMAEVLEPRDLVRPNGGRPGSQYYCLGETGVWLSKWIEAHPAPDEAAEETAEEADETGS